MPDRDSLQRFVFDGFAVRGQIVRLDAAWKAVLERHRYPDAVKPLLGEALAATVLLTSSLKFDGSMTVQIQGDGPVGLVVAQCNHELQVRGLARWKKPVPAAGFRAQVGDGRLVITIQTDRRRQPYQGVVPVAGQTLGECLATYFKTSEQLPTWIWLVADGDRAAGLLLQQMPTEKAVGEDDWRRVRLLARTAVATELHQLTNADWLRRLYREDDLRLFDKRSVSFRCSCSQRRIETMLRALGEAELRSILAEQGRVSVACEFCNRAREFDAVDVERLLAGGTDTDGPAVLH